MTTQASTKAGQTTRATQLIAGIEKELTGVASLTLMGTPYTPAQITTALKTLVTLRSDVDTAKAAVNAKLTAEQTQAPALLGLMAAFVSYVRVSYGGQADVLASFGITPKKVRAPLTTAQQAVANAKSEATRIARGTTGSKAKKAVKGNVVGVVVTPVTVAPPVASPAAPSTSAPAAGVTSSPASHSA